MSGRGAGPSLAEVLTGCAKNRRPLLAKFNGSNPGREFGIGLVFDYEFRKLFRR